MLMRENYKYKKESIMRKKFYAGLVVVGALVALSACSSDEGPTTSENTTKEQEKK